jgi:hypothetical protein
MGVHVQNVSATRNLSPIAIFVASRAFSWPKIREPVSHPEKRPELLAGHQAQTDDHDPAKSG